MLRESDIQNGEAEYTTGCGWIDWGHAYPLRSDVRSIWSQIPHSRLAGEDRLRIRQAPAGAGYLVAYDILIDDVLIQFVPPSLRRAQYIVPNFGADQNSYRGAALSIYKRGCIWAEELQTVWGGTTYNASRYNIEDLVSNLISFYAYVLGWARTEGDVENAKNEIRRHAGGFLTPSVRKRVSLDVWNGMGIVEQADVQLRRQSRSWTHAYLYNDLVPSHLRPNTIRGFTLIPAFFQSIRDVRCRYLTPQEEEQMFREGATMPLAYRRPHQTIPTGSGRGRGRIPGPLGV